MAVANCHCCVAVLFLHHELCHWLANDVASAQHHTFLSACLYVVASEQCDYAEWCGRDEAWQTYCHASHVYRVEAVNILSVVDSLDNLLFVDVLRQWQLYDESIHIVVLVEFLHTVEQFLFRYVVLIANQCGFKSAGLTRQHLVLDVSLRTSVVPHEHSREVWAFAAVGYYLLHFLSNLFLYLGRCGLSVYQLHIFLLFHSVFHCSRHLHHLGTVHSSHHLHHLAHVVELFHQAVNVLYGSSRTLCNAVASALVDDFRV